MSTLRRGDRPVRYAAAAAWCAVLTLLAVAAGGLPGAVGATSPPLPTAGLGSQATPCPAGSTPRAVPAPAPARPTSRPGADPNVTTLPDGRIVRQSCARMPPEPFPGPAIAPANTVGGPLLARPGVIVDLPADVPAPPAMPHVSYVLADLTSGEIIAAKAPHALLRPASTLKTLTAQVAMARLDPSQVVVATAQEAAVEGSRAGLLAGASYTVEDLYNGLIMVSGNDTAYALARAYGGRERLIADMNALAGRLGAWDTVAVDPSGLDAEGQRSSAYDLALIGRAAMQLPEFRRHAALLTATFPGGVDPRGRIVAPYSIPNKNPIIDSYTGTIGIKSGYTSKAGNTFIGAVTRDGRTLILAEMGSPEPQTEATKVLLDWGFAYAAQARPVGRLVSPGTAAQPPEWAHVVGARPVGTAATTARATPDEGAAPGERAAPALAGEPADTAAPAEAETSTEPRTSTEPTALAAAPAAPSADRGMLAGSATAWWSGLPEPARWAVAALVALACFWLGWVLSRRLRHRPRGAFER